MVIVLLVYNGSEEEGRAAFKDFIALGSPSMLRRIVKISCLRSLIGPIADNSKEIPYEELNAMHVSLKRLN